MGISDHNKKLIRSKEMDKEQGVDKEQGDG